MAEMPLASFARLIATINDFKDAKVPVGDVFADVDNDDLALVSGCKWYLNKGGYAFGLINGKRTLMHRLILGDKPGMQIDHKDGNRLNNRKSNLRHCTTAENQQNRRKVSGRSRFKGVRRDRGQWRAQIKIDCKIICLGFHATERLAARAYDAAAKRHFGKFACTNEDLKNY